MVAGEQIAVVLHRQRRTARLLENTQPGPVSRVSGQRHVEDLHEDLPHVVPHPLLEDLDQKVAVLFGGDGAILDRIPFLVAGVVVALDDGDELHEVGLDLVAQEAVDLERMGRVGRVQPSSGCCNAPLCLCNIRAARITFSHVGWPPLSTR